MTDPCKVLIFSLICAEVHGWGWYNYTEATVYTNYLNESVQNPGGKWTDFCNIHTNMCFGIFCDDDQYLDENGECVDINSYLSLSLSKTNGFVFFHDDSPNYTITTKSQEYLKELKTRVNRNDSSVYFKVVDKNVVNAYYGWFEYAHSKNMMPPFTLENSTMLFFVRRDNSSDLLIDYQCSLVDTRLKFIKFSINKWGFSKRQEAEMTWVFTLLSSVCLFFVAIFYACIPELRNNMVGKFLLVLAISEAIQHIVTHITSTILATTVDDIFDNFGTVWFLAMVYETFIVLKYNL
jgi:hypothetical protein